MHLYIAIDLAIIVAAGALGELARVVTLSFVTKAAAAYAGARSGARRQAPDACATARRTESR